MEQRSNFVIGISMQELNSYMEKWIDEDVILLNANEQIICCNSNLLERTGYSASELHLKSVRQLISFDASIALLYRKLVNDAGESAPFPLLPVRSKGGRIDHFKCSIIQMSSEGEDYYLVLLHEFRQYRELSLLQRFSGAFLKDVNLGVLLIDMDFILVDISEMACRVLGVERDKVINRGMEEIFASVPAEHRLVQRTLLDGLVVRNHAVSWTNNQERFELLMDTNVLKADDGQTVGAYIIFKDVTNLRSLEQQVQRSDRLAMIGQIAAGTAHEIRNPLTSIKGFLQMLHTTFQEKQMGKEQEFTQIMLTEINRINELVNEFLLLSKPKNITYDEVDVTAVLREILPIINSEALLHNVTIQYESVEPLPKVVADRELLKQVYLNICKNGIEAMVDGGHLTITERVDEEEKNIHIDFHDTGPGIPVFVIDKIFDPFFTTKPNGTGLGLSVCQRIIHDMGGAVRVSCKGFGTTFTVSIPYP